MNDPKRMKQLKAARNLIDDASYEEKEELFGALISSLKEHDARLEEPDNRFDTHKSHAYHAMSLVRIFMGRMIGYNMDWVPDKFAEHCAEGTGRPVKYDSDIRSTNCFFIAEMVKRGASETQSMKLLMRLRGDGAMTSGHLRELQDSYRDFKNIEECSDHDQELFEYSHHIADFLEFSVLNLAGDEKASHKAVDAFRSFMQELIDLMKSKYGIIVERKGPSAKMYGCVIDWVRAEYSDPLDYFYSHETHKSVPIWDRKHCLSEYLNTINAYTNAGL